MSLTDEQIQDVHRLADEIEHASYITMIFRSQAAEHLRNYANLAAAQAQATPHVLHECLDNDSPWLICKHCGAAGRCDKAAPLAEDEILAAPDVVAL